MTFAGKFVLVFLSRTFSIHWTAEEGERYLFNFSLPLSSATQTLGHQPGDYCREVTSAHSQQPDSNRELYTYLCNTYIHIYCIYIYIHIYIYIIYTYIHIFFEPIIIIMCDYFPKLKTHFFVVQIFCSHFGSFFCIL